MRGNNIIPPHQYKHIRQQATDWVILLASGRATVADGKAFRQWCAQNPAHIQIFSECRRCWQGMQQAAQALPDETSPLMKVRLSRRRMLLGGALAASTAGLALSLSTGHWNDFPFTTSDFHTRTGEQREVIVNPRVRLLMNTQTSVDLYQPEGTIAGITLHSGETEVVATTENNVPFLIMVADGTIQAQNARINVRYTDDVVCVTCLSGQVTVRQGVNSTSLEGNQQLRYGRQGDFVTTQVNTAQIMAWRKRMLVFNNTPLSDVVREINRYRQGKVILLNSRIENNLVQAQFSVDRLADFTSLIEQVYGAKLRQLPGNIVIIS